MLLLQITSAVTAVTLVVLAIYLIPILVELKKTALSLRSIAETLQVELKPLIKDLRDIIADIQVVTSTTAANAEGLNCLMEELGHAGHNIRMINKVIGIASELATKSTALFAGARVAGKFIADRLIKKNRG